MAATLNDTPGSNRLHIGIFGRTNSGKSTFVNAFAGQEVSIVAEVAGTTTDVVSKAMEINPLGPCVIMDTAGFDDESELGERRMEKTRLAAEKTDIAVIVVAAERTEEKLSVEEELRWYHFFQEKKTPVLFLINKKDGEGTEETKIICDALTALLEKETGELPICICAKSGGGMEQVREALARKLPENYGDRFITGELVDEEDVVLLVMPQDIQAPKGRLILPQVQTIRELLDRKCVVMSVTTDKLTAALKTLREPPKLIITDSQVFGEVYKKKPAISMLTSFSVLFAAYKGDLPYYTDGAKKIDALTAHSKVLIAECCAHAPLQEDIGRVKIPRMLRNRFGESLQVDMVSGTDFPQDLSGYDLIIQCGACMFNRKYVMSRIERAKEQKIPMTNYGVAIAHLTGILDKISMVQ